MCQDSNAQVLRPVVNGSAYCGCCGNIVTVTRRAGDTNEIPFYAEHTM